MTGVVTGVVSARQPQGVFWPPRASLSSGGLTPVRWPVSRLQSVIRLCCLVSTLVPVQTRTKTCVVTEAATANTELCLLSAVCRLLSWARLHGKIPRPVSLLSRQRRSSYIESCLNPFKPCVPYLGCNVILILISVFEKWLCSQPVLN